MNQKVSVFVPTYNSSKFLSFCLESLLNQTHPLYEIIVCDDASTDGTQDIVRSFADRFPEQIKPIFQEANLGIPKNFNSGLTATTGDFVSLIAGDDWWEHNKIEKELETLTSSDNARWVYSDSNKFYQSTGRTRAFRQHRDGASGDILADVLIRKISLRNWLAEKSLIEEVGLFDESLDCYEDWDYKIRLAKKAEIAHCPHRTIYYRRSAGTASSNRRSNIPYMQKVQKKHESLLTRFSEQDAEKIKSIWQSDVRASAEPTFIRNAKTAWRKVTGILGFNR